MREINTDEYNKIIEEGKDKIIIMDFYATWCNPCKMLAPVLEELSRTEKAVNIYKIDVDENSDLADRLNIHSVPTLLFYKGGQIQKQLMGFQPLASIKNAIKSL